MFDVEDMIYSIYDNITHTHTHTHTDAVVDAAAVDSPHELAHFLEELAADELRYAKYQARPCIR